MEMNEDVQSKSKYLGIILIDFVPYKEKDKMIEGMKKIYEAANNDFSLVNFINYNFGIKNISDFKRDSPFFSSGQSWHNIVTIWQPGLQRELTPGEIIGNIPNMFSHVEISLRQYTDFAYIITCCGYLKKEYYNNEDTEKEDLEKRTETSEILYRYWFNWDNIPGNDNGRLIDFLKQKLSIDWLKTAKIEKIDNGKTIRVSTEKNFLLLKLNNEKTKLNIEIDDGRADEFITKTKNDKLNIYDDHYYRLEVKEEGGHLNIYHPAGIIKSLIPENEKGIDKNQLELENFLRESCNGIYLNANKFKKDRPSCPSIKILMAETISFDNFKNWKDNNKYFLDSLGINSLYDYSKLELGSDKFLLGYQKAFHSSPTHSMEDFFHIALQFQGLSSGLIIIYSDKGFGGDNVEHDDIVNIIHNHPKCEFVNLFFGVYWPYYQVDIVQKNWENKIEELNKKIMELSMLNDIQELYKKSILDYKDFESFCLIEDSYSKSFMYYNKYLFCI